MSFGLTNVSPTFCTLMDKALQALHPRFVVVNLDDIVIYSRTLVIHISLEVGFRSPWA